MASMGIADLGRPGLGPAPNSTVQDRLRISGHCADEAVRLGYT